MAVVVGLVPQWSYTAGSAGGSSLFVLWSCAESRSTFPRSGHNLNVYALHDGRGARSSAPWEMGPRGGHTVVAASGLFSRSGPPAMPLMTINERRQALRGAGPCALRHNHRQRALVLGGRCCTHEGWSPAIRRSVQRIFPDGEQPAALVLAEARSLPWLAGMGSFSRWAWSSARDGLAGVISGLTVGQSSLGAPRALLLFGPAHLRESLLGQISEVRIVACTRRCGSGARDPKVRFRRVLKGAVHRKRRGSARAPKVRLPRAPRLVRAHRRCGSGARNADAERRPVTSTSSCITSSPAAAPPLLVKAC